MRWRWPSGFVCPVCGGQDHSLVKTRGLYQCTACRRQTSLIAGTIFAATKVPLGTWFRAMYHLTQSKGGISSIELGRRLGVTQTITAWKIKHKLMQVMMERDATKRLTGRIEIDDAYLGGERNGAKLGRKLYEVPVGFKWFVDGRLDGPLGFGGEESAGAAFTRRDGSVWTTDEDGIVPALLSAEITARIGRDPGDIYRELAREFGEPVYDRVEAPATPEQKQRLQQLSAQQIPPVELAGEKIQSILTQAPGNGAPIAGVKVIAASGWFAARPSGTEDIYKIYGESFRGADHLRRNPGRSTGHRRCCAGGACLERREISSRINPKERR